MARQLDPSGWGRVVLVTSSTRFAPPPGMVAPGLTRTPHPGTPHAEANVPESFTERHLDASRGRDYAPARVNK